MSYLDRVRELHKELSLARDSVARVEILDRMLFVIEAQSRAWKLQDSSLDLAAPLLAKEIKNEAGSRGRGA
jgi:hypothetical protein